MPSVSSSARCGVVAARHHDDHLGLARPRPRSQVARARALAGEAQHVLAARVLDQLRHPVARDEQRVEPLERGDARAGLGVAHREAHAVDAVGAGPARASTPSSSRSVAAASVRTSPSTSPSVPGSSEMHLGLGRHAAPRRRARRRTDTAQTAQSAWVTIRSGCELVELLLVELVDRLAARRCARARRASISPRTEALGDHAARECGSRSTPSRVVALVGDGD